MIASSFLELNNKKLVDLNTKDFNFNGKERHVKKNFDTISILNINVSCPSEDLFVYVFQM
jgi:hypothetical protein